MGMIVARDTIAAIATPSGKGGVGILRISGSRIEPVCLGMLGCIPNPRVATFLPFLDSHGSAIDEGIALLFRRPASFTGEDVLELQAHGSPIVLDLLLSRVMELGARIAKPGEFSERAFLNGKMDLIQAEAVADLITADSAQAARSAMRAMQGDFSLWINEIADQLTELRIFLEAAIDFSEEDNDFLSDGMVGQRLTALVTQVQKVLSTARQGCLLRDGITLVIAGSPNAGKSSLLNTLTNKATAIVTNSPGTTRDVLREVIEIDGFPFQIIDTAGLRHSDDPVEREGVRRARQEINQADRILWMVDASDPERDLESLEDIPPGAKVTKLLNKIDLTGELPSIVNTKVGTNIRLSVKSGAGMDLLYQHLRDCAGHNNQIENVFIARRRHLDALVDAETAIKNAIVQLNKCHFELVAEEMRLAHQALSQITGAFTTDDLLEKIFSNFCIGK